MLPEKFKIRMAKLLGNSANDFFGELELEKAEKALRVNSIKADSNEDAISALKVSKIPYCDEGYYLEEDVSIGKTPEHAAGMIYSQDAGAMAAVASIDIADGAKILDLCAAPGGKSTQAIAKIRDTGIIISNEYVAKRAKILVGNFERMGIKNGIVTSLDTKEISKLFSAYFDVVIVDAPCSGEGMFRKDCPAIEEWSEENVALCRNRQLEILENAYSTVKDGGTLLYSTCTYSIEENESVVDEFLKRHTDFSIADASVRVKNATSDGIVFDGCERSELKKCRRFYPHVSRGEGQFLAVLKRNTDDMPTILYKDGVSEPSKDVLKIVTDFFGDNLNSIPNGRIVMRGENLSLVPDIPIPKTSVFSAGVIIGEIKGKILVPSHQFFSAFGKDFKRKENITDTALAMKYLAGDEIPQSFSGNGFCAVLYKGAPIGGGKASGGMIKNHYPKGLRIR